MGQIGKKRACMDWRMRISTLLCLMLAFGIIPSTVLAAEAEPDTTPPVSSSDAKASYTGEAVITITATDTGPAGSVVSGVKQVSYMVLGSGAQVTTTGRTTIVTVLTPGSYTLEFWAEDHAGNKEARNTVNFTVTPDDGGGGGGGGSDEEKGNSITRVNGADRFATAIDVSKKNFKSADAVILATGMNYADALSASALAGSLKAPLLLTRSDTLSAGVRDEIKRLGAGEVWIMGSDAAVSKAVKDELSGAGLSVERIAGADRYETSAKITQAVAALAGPSFAKKAFLARGDNFADGLAVSPLAYRNKIPVILTRPTSLSWAAADIIKDMKIADVTILGSSAAVSVDVENAIKALDTNPKVRRVQGATRYETAQKIAEYAFANSLATRSFIGVATGLNFPDALAGGAAAGKHGGILALTTPEILSANWASYLPGAYGSAKPKPDIQIYGGNNVVSDNVMEKLRDLLLD